MRKHKPIDKVVPLNKCGLSDSLYSNIDNHIDVILFLHDRLVDDQIGGDMLNEGYISQSQFAELCHDMDIEISSFIKRWERYKHKYARVIRNSKLQVKDVADA